MNRNSLVVLSMALLFVFIFIFSLFIGRFPIPPGQIWRVLLGFLSGELTPHIGGQAWSVFYYIRLPRVILVAGVGAALAVTGAAYQSVFRNPLVSPDILGVSAGAGFGVALGMLFTGNTLVYLLSFICGILAVGLTFLIAKLAGSGMMIMVLGGIAVSALFNAAISLLKYLADPYDKLPGIIFYLMGGFSRVGWSEVVFTLPLLILGVGLIYLLRWALNIMSMGEEEALALGLNVRLLRGVMIGVSTMMVSAAVATTGQITWFGLILPHMARYLAGADHRYMIPTAALLGSSLLLIMDDLARNLSGAEIPISIISAFLGAPFFIYLLLYRRESGWS